MALIAGRGELDYHTGQLAGPIIRMIWPTELMDTAAHGNPKETDEHTSKVLIHLTDLLTDAIKIESWRL